VKRKWLWCYAIFVLFRFLRKSYSFKGWFLRNVHDLIYFPLGKSSWVDDFSSFVHFRSFWTPEVWLCQIFILVIVLYNLRHLTEFTSSARHYFPEGFQTSAVLINAIRSLAGEGEMWANTVSENEERKQLKVVLKSLLCCEVYFLKQTHLSPLVAALIFFLSFCVE
jgi:hypothetical protein